jgi:2-C-methyl-D-erythritol 4-phosphate cytidylyltransferase/2-C-methyl-D-erythritol 2,4-cyclodiphosphate synthase
MSGVGASEESFAALIVAAGSGTRFGRSKHDLWLGGKPLWRWSVEAFEEAGASEIVVVGDVPGGVPGGSRRRDSVRAGLDALSSGSPIVLIHDAARPLVGSDLIEAVVAAIAGTGVEGAIPVIPVTDTIKRVEDSHVGETVDRSALVAVQTPQGFVTQALMDAHRTLPSADVTDDATLVERNGGIVVIVDGDRANIKITFPGDLAMAEAIVAGGVR